MVKRREGPTEKKGEEAYAEPVPGGADEKEDAGVWGEEDER